MRTETQKKIDQKSGLEDVEFHFDNETGEVVQTGKVLKRFNMEELEKSLPEYRVQVEKWESEIKETKAKLEELKGIENDEEIQNFLMVQAKVAKLSQKKNLEGQLLAREEEIQFHKDSVKDQNRFVEQFVKWRKEFRKPIKEAESFLE